MPARLFVGMIVRQIGDMTISVSGPPHSRSSTCATSAALAAPTANGTSLKSPSDLLQERQLHLQRVLQRVRGIARHHLRQVAQSSAARRDRSRTAPERRRERLGARHAPGRAPGRGAPARAAPRGAPCRARRELVVGARRDRRRSRCSRHAARSAPWDSRAAARSSSTPPSSSSSSARQGLRICRDRRCRRRRAGRTICMRFFYSAGPIRSSTRSTPCSAWMTDCRRTASRSPRSRRVSLRVGPPAAAQAKHTVPTGLSALPPPGPGDAGDGERDVRAAARKRAGAPSRARSARSPRHAASACPR